MLIAGLTAGILMYKSVKAQDFFNGMPGPKLTQSDNYITLDAKTNELSGKYIQKVFPALTEDSNVLIAAPFVFDKKGIDMKGINLGYMKQHLLDKDIYATFATGAFEGSTGKLTQITPQAYITMLQDKLSIDLEGAINFDLESGNKQKNATVTLGYGNSRIRGGASVIFNNEKIPSYQLLGRFDLTEDHKYWVELYSIDNKKAGLRFAANF